MIKKYLVISPCFFLLFANLLPYLQCPMFFSHAFSVCQLLIVLSSFKKNISFGYTVFTSDFYSIEDPKISQLTSVFHIEHLTRPTKALHFLLVTYTLFMTFSSFCYLYFFCRIVKKEGDFWTFGIQLEQCFKGREQEVLPLNYYGL